MGLNSEFGPPVIRGHHEFLAAHVVTRCQVACLGAASLGCLIALAMTRYAAVQDVYYLSPAKLCQVSSMLIS